MGSSSNADDCTSIDVLSSSIQLCSLSSKVINNRPHPFLHSRLPALLPWQSCMWWLISLRDRRTPHPLWGHVTTSKVHRSSWFRKNSRLQVWLQPASLFLQCMWSRSRSFRMYRKTGLQGRWSDIRTTFARNLVHLNVLLLFSHLYACTCVCEFACLGSNTTN